LTRIESHMHTSFRQNVDEVRLPKELFPRDRWRIGQGQQEAEYYHVVQLEKWIDQKSDPEPWERANAQRVGLEVERIRDVVKEIIRSSGPSDAWRRWVWRRWELGLFDSVTRDDFVIHELVLPTLKPVPTGWKKEGDSYPYPSFFVNTGCQQSEDVASLPYEEGNRNLPFELFQGPIGPHERKRAVRPKRAGTRCYMRGRTFFRT